MFKDTQGWFPSPFFTNLFPMLVFATFFIDYIVPRLTAGKGAKPFEKSDRGSYLVISMAVFLALAIGISIRQRNIGTSSGLFQWAGLIVMLVGLFLREWALVKLGRFFSRSVQIEPGHRIIKEGPYRWIRHPAYTGMLLIDTGVVMAIGTWLGALLAFIITTAGILYRITVEEKALLQTFGMEYQEYMAQTWKLLPGW